MAYEYSSTLYPSGYDSANSSYYSLDNIANAYTSHTSSTYARIHLKRGSGAQTKFYFTFNLSSIPANANISSIECRVNCKISHTEASQTIGMCYTNSYGENLGNSDNLSSSYLYDYALGTMANTTNIVGLDCQYYLGYTLDEFKTLKLKLQVTRSTSNYNADHYIDFYGATLTVKYLVGEATFSGNIHVNGAYRNLTGGHANVGGAWHKVLEQYVNIGGVWKPCFNSEISSLRKWSKILFKPQFELIGTYTSSNYWNYEGTAGIGGIAAIYGVCRHGWNSGFGEFFELERTLAGSGVALNFTNIVSALQSNNNVGYITPTHGTTEYGGFEYVYRLTYIPSSASVVKEKITGLMFNVCQVSSDKTDAYPEYLGSGTGDLLPFDYYLNGAW